MTLNCFYFMPESKFNNIGEKEFILLDFAIGSYISRDENIFLSLQLAKTALSLLMNIPSCLPTQEVLCLQMCWTLRPKYELFLGAWAICLNRNEVSKRCLDSQSPRLINAFENQVTCRGKCYLFAMKINEKQFLQH